MIFFTADEHLGHRNIIKYCTRPFVTVEDMNETIISNHNSVVKPGDLVIHIGDFTLEKKAKHYIQQLAGNHIFLRGSHDKWLKNGATRWEGEIEGQWVVADHYALRVWPKSHFGSWMVYGHSHGNLPPLGKQHDVGVDANNFFPVSFQELKVIMAGRDDNPNLLKGDDRGAVRKDEEQDRGDEVDPGQPGGHGVGEPGGGSSDDEDHGDDPQSRP